ncbi:hypothetical protein IB277_30975 [Ensifer sp. ENS07]|uniref:hypothetical protein n=1 Tax=Ensifer sp. ENS07 TaxID=2769274 RepID=UPI00177D0D0B|nr:hypothetical protein [Ensifer sp. ENS07]MBD9640722.1 hypothetical protein [Ensifer sp. ENS07]
MAKPTNQKSTKAPFLKGGKAPDPINPDDFPPAFSFEKMQDGSGHSFNCCQDDDRLHLAKRIFMLSRLPWKEIRNTSAKGLGSEDIPKYRIKPPVPNSVTHDVTYFHSLHYVGKKRFVGYRVGQIFYVLWIDHNFKVYSHG